MGDKKSERDARLAQALRENLRRRKAAARRRPGSQDGEADAPLAGIPDQVRDDGSG